MNNRCHYRFLLTSAVIPLHSLYFHQHVRSLPFNISENVVLQDPKPQLKGSVPYHYQCAYGRHSHSSYGHRGELGWRVWYSIPLPSYLKEAERNTRISRMSDQHCTRFTRIEPIRAGHGKHASAPPGVKHQNNSPDASRYRIHNRNR